MSASRPLLLLWCWLALKTVLAFSPHQLSLPYPPNSAALGGSLPFTPLSPTTVNYSRHFAVHQLDESLLFSPFASSQPSPALISHLPLVVALTPATTADDRFAVHSFLFSTCEEGRDDCTQPACSSLHSHGLHLHPCPTFPASLLPSGDLSLLLSYRPTRTQVPTPYYLLINTTAGLYSSPLRVLIPPTFSAYQSEVFSTSSPLLATGGDSALAAAFRLMTAALPLLLCLAAALLLLLAQAGFVCPEQLHSRLAHPRLHGLQRLHHWLTPYLYPAHLTVASHRRIQPVTAAATPTPSSASPALLSAAASPSHLLRRRPKAFTPSSASTASSAESPTSNSTSASTSTSATASSPSSRQLPSSSAHRRRDSLHSLLSHSFLELSPSSLDLSQLSLRHHKSVSLGTGESMLKEAERQLKRRKAKEARRAAKAAKARAGDDEVKEPQMTSPPKTRRTMSVGATGPIFFRFDRVVREAEDSEDSGRSSDDSVDSSTRTPSTGSSESADEKFQSREGGRSRPSAAATPCPSAPAAGAQQTAVAKQSLPPPDPASAVHSVSSAPAPVPSSPSSPSASLMPPASPASLGTLSPQRSPLPGRFRPATSAEAAQSAAASAMTSGPPTTSTLSASAAPYVSPRQASPLPPSQSRGGFFPKTQSPRSAPYYPSQGYAANAPLPPSNIPSPSSRAYASHSGRVLRPPGLPSSPVHYPPMQLAAGLQSPHGLHPSLLAQHAERVQAQEKAQAMAAYLQLQQQAAALRYPAPDLASHAYPSRADAPLYSAPQSPVARPPLPQLVLPRSPDVGPVASPVSPQALRPALSPNQRYPGMVGAGMAVGAGMRDGRWSDGASAGPMGAGGVSGVSDWYPPAEAPPPHRRQLTPFHLLPPVPATTAADLSPLFEIREEGEAQAPLQAAALAGLWTAEARPQSLLARSAAPASASSPFFAASALALPLAVDTAWTTPPSPSAVSLLRGGRPLSSSQPQAEGLLAEDAVADDEDLMDLQAMESWDAENDRRSSTQKGGEGKGGSVAHVGPLMEEDEEEEEEEGMGTHRKDSMNGGLAEALGRARALHSIGLSLAQVKAAGMGGGEAVLHAGRPSSSDGMDTSNSGSATTAQ